MKLISHGAAREVTGSCHELQIGAHRILLDCGLFQGSRKASAEKNSTFVFDPSKDIDAVILTHAHMDHVGRIPVLHKRGYRGPIYCTYATKDLAPVMLQDGGYLQEKDEEFFRKHCADTMMACEGPLYTQEDAANCAELFVGKNYSEWFEVLPGIKAKFLDAGHVLGAAMVVLEIDQLRHVRHAERSEAPQSGAERSRSTSQGSGDSASMLMRDASISLPFDAAQGRSTQHDVPVLRIGFSGDLGRATLPIIRDPEPMPPVDMLICESTYGNRLHEDVLTAKHRLAEVIQRTVARGGKVLIPAFSLERTQEILYDLHLLWDEKNIPEVPIIIDSPLASRVTEIFMKHPECYDRAMYEQFLSRAHNPFQFSLVRYTTSVEESKKLNTYSGPMIIMAGSGMCEGGRIRHHLTNYIEDPKSTVLAVGYMAENTLGRRIIEKSISTVRIFDQEYRKRAETVYINAYSGHADMRDLDSYITAIQGVKKLFLVHGEEQGMLALMERMKKSMTADIVMPERGVTYSL
ncbi:MAG TPA: MBL fold metallo-hydrolase [Candidatus Peribacterales bacterium]|nr:MBL fold metallo-hydrolase [Candidatus Peribacterales bacterium]